MVFPSPLSKVRCVQDYACCSENSFLPHVRFAQDSTCRRVLQMLSCIDIVKFESLALATTQDESRQKEKVVKTAHFYVAGKLN